MRNLLGRLNARSAEELGRISVAWQVPVSGNDKLGQVAQLYRALTDATFARDIWTRLPDDERALITLLLSGTDASRPLAEIATMLGEPEPEVRQIAARLYFKGIIVREGDDDPLPVGHAPRLFLPREVGQVLKRITDEIAAGDVSGAPIAKLLEQRDDRQIEESAEHWGVRVIPGLRTREELLRQMLVNLGDAKHLQVVESRLHREAARIWPRVRDAVDGKPVSLADVMAAEDVSVDDFRKGQRFREALAELEEKLLVWHTYRSDGTRWLFVPAEIRSPEAATAEVTPNPPPATVPVEAPPPIGHPYAVAWDLLTLLRALSPPQEHRIADLAAVPGGWLRRLNAGLWNRGAELPPAGYLDFLVDLARVEGVLTGGDAAIDEPFLVTPAVRAWRDRTFAEQTARLRASWLSSTSWIEGSNRDDIEIWGADWPGFRLKLLAHMAPLKRDGWYPLEAAATWLARRDPDMLGSSFEATSARNPQFTNDEAANRRVAIAEVVVQSLETAFCWFGMADLLLRGREPRLVRLRLDHAVQPEPDADVAALELSDDGEITLKRPSPLLVWSVSAFADLDELAAEAMYRLTANSIARALQAGFEIQHVETFLAKQSGAPLPATVQASIQTWSQSLNRVRVSRVLRLSTDGPEQLQELLAVLERAGRSCVTFEHEIYVSTDGTGEVTAEEKGLLDVLAAAGFAPQGLERRTTPGVQRPKAVHPVQKRR